MHYSIITRGYSRIKGRKEGENEGPRQCGMYIGSIGRVTRQFGKAIQVSIKIGGSQRKILMHMRHFCGPAAAVETILPTPQHWRFDAIENSGIAKSPALI